jgi:hypothetical protein
MIKKIKIIKILKQNLLYNGNLKSKFLLKNIISKKRGYIYYIIIINHKNSSSFEYFNFDYFKVNNKNIVISNYFDREYTQLKFFK